MKLIQLVGGVLTEVDVAVGGGVPTLEVEINFGTISNPIRKWSISDPSINTFSKILVFQSPRAASDRVGNDWEMDLCEFTGEATGEFTGVIKANPRFPMVGKRYIYFQVIN